MRRISDMAKMGILGTLFGTLISIPVVYFLREEGVVLSLVLIAAMSLLTSWWYSRKIHIQTPSISASQVGQEAAALLKLGFAFMTSGLLMTGAAYAVRLIVVRKVGFDAAGLYQAAWALGGLYIGFILQAMGADFYPRLTAIANDNTECNRVVNEQAHVSLLLAGPGVIATLTFAPLVIALFYTPKFEGAVEILRWLCLGMTLRVISWPMGFIIVAKDVQNLLIFSELAWTVVYLGLAWVCVSVFRFERCRYRVLWIVCFSCAYDLRNCSAAQRFSLVHREHANKFSLSCLDRSRFLQLLCIATLVGDGGRYTGYFTEWCLLASSSPQSHFPGPDSPSRTKVTTVAPSCAFKLQRIQ